MSQLQASNDSIATIYDGVLIPNKQVNIPFANDGGYIAYSNGEVSSINYYSYSDSIELKKGEKCVYNLRGGGSAAILAVYINNSYVKAKSIKGVSESSVTTGEFIANEDCVIKLCSTNTNNDCWYAIKKFPSSILPSFSNRKWAVFGDSLTAVTSSPKHYYDYVADKTNINIINYGVSGSGYANGGSAGNKQFYNRISAIDTDFDVITIFGSFNDLEMSSQLPLGDITDTDETSSICGCINKTISNLYTIKPIVKLGIVTPTPWHYRKPTVAGNSDAELYVNAIINICKLRSIPILDLFHCSNLRPWDTTFRSIAFRNSDGVHPNAIGHNLFASQFYEFINKLISV
jgi:lysophospholipase L1-like esterase